MRRLSLLAVDDDPLVLDAIGMAAGPGWVVHKSNSEPNPLPEPLDAAIVDVHLNSADMDWSGLRVMQSLSGAIPHLEIIAMSGDLNRDTMERCLKAGAHRFLAKPISTEELVLTLDKIEALIQMRHTPYRRSDRTYFWIGQGAESQRVKRQIAALRREAGPILIEGETGTGKEVAARLIHAQEDPRPFIAINVAGIPENLFESEMFGHTRGAFTGADQNKIGLIEAADGGDLFLDEIEALSPSHQAKLLRFLETSEVRSVGSHKTKQVKTRVIVATNKSLEKMVKAEEFREDLYWRLARHRLNLPPLRERKEDIPELAQWFFANEKVHRKELGEDALAALHSYTWPGNVRELKRVCEQLCVAAPLPLVRGEDVERLLRADTAGTQTLELDYAMGLDKLVANFERAVILQCIQENPDVDVAAKTLKISRSNLYKKIKDYDISWRKP